MPSHFPLLSTQLGLQAWDSAWGLGRAQQDQVGIANEKSGLGQGDREGWRLWWGGEFTLPLKYSN